MDEWSDVRQTQGCCGRTSQKFRDKILLSREILHCSALKLLKHCPTPTAKRNLYERKGRPQICLLYFSIVFPYNWF